MKKPGLASVYRAPGYIDLYDNTRRRVTVNLTHRLPDGSRLTDKPNEKLLRTLLSLADEGAPRRPGHSNTSAISSIFLLIQWMFLRSLYSFGSLKRQHFEEFLKDSCQGLDFLIDATPRLHTYLSSLKDLPEAERRAMNVPTLFSAAGIPPTYAAHLKRATALASDYLSKGRAALTAAPKEPQVEELSLATISGRAGAIRRLWTLRERLADPASVEPFTDDSIRYLRKRARQSQQTEVIPSQIAIKLLCGVVDVVMKIGPLFLQWDSTRAPGRFRSAADAESFDRLRNAIEQQTGMVLGRRLRPSASDRVAALTVERTLIPLACQVAILAYTGRRKVEVETLESDCIRGSQEEGRNLTAYIAKRQTYESRPCPEFVARAVELMNAYHNHARDDVQPLFHLRHRSGPMRLAHRVDEIARFVGAISYTNRKGEQRIWHWKPHQFRRLYAILYIWRYEGSSYLVLKHYFGHGSEREAAYYARLASDENFIDLVQEAGLFTQEKLREISKSEGGFSGPFADVVRKRIERTRLNLRLTSADGLEAVLTHLVDEEGLVMQASPWGYCACKPTPSNMRRAACRQGKNAERPKHLIFNTPVPESSSEETCASCHFHTTNTSRLPHWRNIVSELDRAIGGGRPDSIATRMLAQRREKIYAAAKRFFGEAAIKGNAEE